MRTVLAVVAAVFAVGAWAEDTKGSLEGTWAVSVVERDGKPVEDAKDSTLTFAGKALTIKSSTSGEQKGTFTTDTAKSPMTIDIKPSDQEQMILGIYAIEKGELKLCVGRPGSERPKAFTGKTPEAILILAKREKK
jgi:uncharacterized protein (TIGR03067 family)